MRRHAVPSPLSSYAFLGLFPLIASIGCTVVSDFDVHQCSTTRDCELPGLPTMRCENSQCVPGCESNTHCASRDPRAPLCEHPGGRCISLFAEDSECTAALGYDELALRNDTLQDVDVIGAFVPGPRTSTLLSVELAARELDPALAGLGGRRMITLLCHDSPSTVADAMSHIVDELGSMAILAPARGRAMRAVSERAASLSPSFLLRPSGSAEPAGEDASELLWHLGPEYAATLTIYERLLPQAISVASARASGSLQLASIIGDDPEDGALAEAVRGMVDVAGRDARALTIADQLRELALYSPDPGTLEVEPERLSNYAPGLVLLFTGVRESTGALSATTLVENIEARAAASGALPPLYILGPRLVDDVRLRNLVVGRESLRARVVGVRADPAVDSATSSELQARFHSAYPQARGSALDIVPSVYDGMYILSLALTAGRSRAGALAARDVALGFDRLTDPAGPRLSIGPGVDRVDSALLAARDGRPMMLMGASGPIQLDRQRHTRPGVPRAYSITSEGALAERDSTAVFNNFGDDDR